MFSCTAEDRNGPDDPIGCACHTPELQSLHRRLSADLSRRGFIAGVGASLAMLGLPSRAKARAGASGPAPSVVFRNFRLFDGTSAALRDGMSLLVENGRIASLASGNPAPPDGAQVIDCGGRVLMPGLIDAHWHALFAAIPVGRLLEGDIGYIHLVASAESERTLLRGFTTVRDLGGPSFAFKQAIDEGLVIGPRIYPSGGMITTSGGHGDLRPLTDVPRSPGGKLSLAETMGGAAIADGADEVRLRAREQLLQGASQIKLVGGGGVSSPRSPVDITTFSVEELRAGIEVAEDWGTFATVHAYAPTTVQRAIHAGARCIEHAHLMDEATAALMAEKDVWLSIQPFMSDADSVPLVGPSRVAQLKVIGGTDAAYKLAIKHGIKTAFGSDMLFSAALAARQGTMLTHLTNWYSNAEILKMATSSNAELLGLSGPRNPYPGKLGVVEEGAFADLLLVDGNPLENIELLATPETGLAVIMKDGRVYKNTLSPASP